MPKVIYCLHALSSHLFKIGKAPLIHDVFGKAVFTGNYIILILFNYTILALLPYKWIHSAPKLHQTLLIFSQTNGRQRGDRASCAVLYHQSRLVEPCVSVLWYTKHSIIPCACAVSEFSGLIKFCVNRRVLYLRFQLDPITKPPLSPCASVGRLNLTNFYLFQLKLDK